MSSFEEENLYEMVDDFLDSESAPPPLLPPFSAESPFLNGDHTKYYVLQEIVESGASNAEFNVLKSVRKKLVDGGKINININIIGDQKKWLVKSLIKDGYNASLCHTYWPTSLNCPGGEYEYIHILCDQSKKQHPRRMIVDIDFKSQFELARPTSSYQKLCDILPQLFVGDEQKLRKIISIVCGEAKNSFRERGLYVPPWRTPCYMLSKWFSPSHQKKQAARDDHVLFFSSKLMPRRKYLGVGQCGLSSQFSSIATTECN